MILDVPVSSRTPGSSLGITRVVAGFMQRPDGRVWVGLRAGAYAGTWEFPGGKVDPGETDEQALVRELKEELSIDVKVGEYLVTTPPLESGDGRTFEVALYEVLEISGEPECNPEDHQEGRWMLKNELLALEAHEMTPSLPTFLRRIYA